SLTSLGGPKPKCVADCPETQKLETPTKKRFLLLPAESKFRSFQEAKLDNTKSGGDCLTPTSAGGPDSEVVL
ncbi:MAG: hypothetical protein WB217_11815, partial [Mesobacillus sp.]|uniref:hypothetical protein n=1 Tax=Mesobacillus sp. TaxID=2675271 RepID=UPI003C4A2546